jgi:hypothetical protein
LQNPDLVQNRRFVLDDEGLFLGQVDHGPGIAFDQELRGCRVFWWRQGDVEQGEYHREKDGQHNPPAPPAQHRQQASQIDHRTSDFGNTCISHSMDSLRIVMGHPHSLLSLSI